jgi:hypothetical protein
MSSSVSDTASGDIAILIESESESSSDVDVDKCIDNVIETHENVDILDMSFSPHVHNACEVSSGTATMPPTHPDDDVSAEYEKVVVLRTCTELLEKLEAIRLSVLHLQYSLHASEVCAVSTESVDRSRTLWNWDNMNIVSMPPNGNTVSMEPNGNTVTTQELGQEFVDTMDMSRTMWSFDNMNPLIPIEQSVEELEEGERLSRDAISAGINVFDGCTTDDFDDGTSKLRIDSTSHTDDAAASDL